MIQGGDPDGTGTGGESAWGEAFPDNINPQSPLYQAGYRRGIVAYANAGPNTNGSQFFIMHMDFDLPPSYVIFGRVTSGITTVDALADVRTEPGGDGAMSKPVEPQVMKKVTIKP
jgi:cyclophilin family peptidyl-prolyl cis-trans isomerase